MNDKNEYNNNSDANIFDDISHIIPKKHAYRPTHREISCVTVEFGQDNGPDTGKLDYTAAEHSKTEQFSYTPQNLLITSVNIRPRISPVGFYGDFAEDAKKYLEMHGRPCEFSPFPAYVPEYRSMKKAQLDYYFYFRDSVKKQTQIKTSLSYILLMLFEIINLPELIAPCEGIKLMCRLFIMYHKEFDKLDCYIANWLCDYCLIHKLPLPDEISPFAEEFAKLSGFPEFYLDPQKTSRFLLLLHISGYSPDPEGKYPETHSLLETHLPAAMAAAVPELDFENTAADPPSAANADPVTLTAMQLQPSVASADPRTLAAIHLLPSVASADPGMLAAIHLLPMCTGARSAYRSALCTHGTNALISYTYRSLGKPSLLREKLADIIKYCENRIRASLSIRARLKCPLLGNAERAAIDAYFDRELPSAVRAKRQRNNANADTALANEALYAPESHEFSIDAALGIERDSWTAAEILADVRSDSDESGDLPPQTETAEPVDDRDIRPGKNELEYLRLLIEGEPEALKTFLKQRGLFADALAESLNTYAFDTIGDSILEPSDDGYSIIPDYIQEATQWLKQ